MKRARGDVDDDGGGDGDGDEPGFHSGLMEPPDDVERAQSESDHSGPIGEDLSGVVHVRIAGDGLAEDGFEVTARDPEAPAHEGEEGAKALPFDEGVAPAPSRLVHLPKLEAGFADEGDFRHQEEVEEPDGEEDFEFDEVAEADGVGVDVRQQGGEEAGEVEESAVGAYADAGPGGWK